MSTAMSWRVCRVLQQFPSANMSKAITIMCVVRINVNKCVFGRRKECKKLMSSSKIEMNMCSTAGRHGKERKLKTTHSYMSYKKAGHKRVKNLEPSQPLHEHRFKFNDLLKSAIDTAANSISITITTLTLKSLKCLMISQHEVCAARNRITVCAMFSSRDFKF